MRKCKIDHRAPAAIGAKEWDSRVELNRFYPARRTKLSVTLSRAEKGTFHGEKAHFIVLKVERGGDIPELLKQVSLRVSVETESTASQSPNVHRPAIVLFSPKRVAGAGTVVQHSTEASIEGDIGIQHHASLGLKGNKKRSASFESAVSFEFRGNVDDGSTYESDLSALGKGKTDVSGMSVLHLWATANPLSDEGIPDITIGLIVITHGQPFIMTVQGEAAPKKRRDWTYVPLSLVRPIIISELLEDRRQPGDKGLGVDFGSPAMDAQWARVVAWTKMYNMIPAHSQSSRMPTSESIPAPTLYDAADFSDEAILASYQSHEDDIDFSEQDLPELDIIDQDSVLHPIYGGPHLGEWKTVFRKKKKEEKVDPSELLDNHLKVEVNRLYASRKIKIVTSVSRAERGVFHGDKAHFIVLKVERKGSEPLELESLYINVMVEKVQPAPSASAPALLRDSTKALSGLSLDSGAQTGPLPTNTSPDAPDSLDPLQIIRFAPEKVVGLPSTIKYTDDLEIEGDLGFDAYGAKLGAKGTRKWGKEYEREERFSVWANVDDEATYESDRAAAAGKTKKEDSGMNVLHVCASANILHNEGIPNLTIGLVVISYGQPFILTVVGEAKPFIGDSIFFRPFSRVSPAKFSYQSKAHLPHGQAPITDDFGSKNMNKHWKRLVDWPLEFRNNLLGGA